MSASPDEISELLHSTQKCISDVKAWAIANMPILNDNKTELMLVTSNRTKHLHDLPTSITIGNAQIPFLQSVKNLGFTLDCHHAMNAHVSNIARTCYIELRRLTTIRGFLTSSATATLVFAYVLSRIDCCDNNNNNNGYFQVLFLQRAHSPFIQILVWSHCRQIWPTSSLRPLQRWSFTTTLRFE